MKHQRIKEYIDSNAGIDLKEFLISNLNELRDIENVREYSKGVDQAIELKAQKKAYLKLKAIYDKIMTIEKMETAEDREDWGS